MYHNILNIINNYVNNNKNPDKEFILSIIEIFNKDYYKSKTLKHIIMDNYKYFNARYSPQYNIICIDSSFFDKYPCITNVTETLLSLFHEYVHVIQFENLKNKKGNICDKLVNSSFTTFIKNNNDDYLHDHIPVERLANLSSLSCLIDILSLDKERYNNIILYYKRRFFQYLIGGYELKNNKRLFPLEILFSKTNLDNYIPSLINSAKKLSFQERLLFGFPITEKEFEVVRKEYINCVYNEEEYKKRILKRREK